jgi:hypothetical protein
MMIIIILFIAQEILNKYYLRRKKKTKSLIMNFFRSLIMRIRFDELMKYYIDSYPLFFVVAKNSSGVRRQYK